jgi:hypothetical protein
MPENSLQANRRVLKRGTLGLYCHDYATNWRTPLWLSGVYSTFIEVIITINVTYYHSIIVTNSTPTALVQLIHLILSGLQREQTINITLIKAIVLTTKLAVGSNFTLLVYDLLALFIAHLIQSHR